ncbi:MAG: MarR family winged helix-turn-helix transcriptional regulator [Sneathiellales bacterium]|nr:MarR family winged helix-turn-helix transcriptional regulator [Sneathiellales bacterium]
MQKTDINAWIELHRSSQKLISIVETELKNADLPPLAWYDILLEIKKAGKDGIRPFELQNRVLITQYNLSRMTDRLVRAGYAKRIPCLEDKRGHSLITTRKGINLLDRMWPIYETVIDQHFSSKLAEADKARLSGILKRI